MLTFLIVGLFRFCTRYAWQVVAAGLIIAVASGIYAARHFAINSDISTLLSSDLDWRKRELEFERAFQRYKLILVVIPAPTPQLRQLRRSPRRSPPRKTRWGR